MSQLGAFWKYGVLCFRTSRITAKRWAHSASLVFFGRENGSRFSLPSVACGFSGERDLRGQGSKKEACRECPGQVPIPGSLGKGRIEIRRDTFSLAQMGKCSGQTPPTVRVCPADTSSVSSLYCFVMLFYHFSPRHEKNHGKPCKKPPFTGPCCCGKQMNEAAEVDSTLEDY